jgi:hypothetical protein
VADEGRKKYLRSVLMYFRYFCIEVLSTGNENCDILRDTTVIGLKNKFNAQRNKFPTEELTLSCG